MNDDTLYGWIDPGQSKPFPSGMTFSYSSDRPGVVSVDGSTIRTVANGVATITATATYHGVSEVDELRRARALRPELDLPSAGQPCRGFSPDIYDYDVDRCRPASRTHRRRRPRRRAARYRHAGNRRPGTATVVSTGPDGIVAHYTVNFAAAAHQRRVQRQRRSTRSGRSCARTPPTSRSAADR